MVVAKGGKGGRGNATFATATQQAPYIAEQGEKGETATCRLELKLLADVGIVGKPNAGKSTFLSAATSARPKIAPYPFTTTEPVLGVATVGWRTYVLAEIPGLLEGAHLGIGLGHEFLRHATRTRVLIHLVDGTADDVVREVRDVNGELAAYGAGLDQKPQIIVVNKVDLPEVAERLAKIKAALRRTGLSATFVSALARVGVQEVVEEAARMLTEAEKTRREDAPVPVQPPVAAHRGPKAARRNGAYMVLDERALRLAAGSDLTKWAGRAQLKAQFDRLGVTRSLEDLGIKPGDTLWCGEMEMEW